MAKLRAVLIGATGLAGQQFIAALKNHPFFELTGLAASPRSAGKTYEEALRSPSGMLGWYLPEALPPEVAKMRVQAGTEVRARDYDLCFSAVESDVARELEPALARDIPVISAASAFRYDDDVPLLIPPVNAAHAPMIVEQKRRRGWKGFIAPIPNCTTTGLAITLAPLEEAFGLQAVLMTSMQAMSGAGRSPGVIGIDILDNVIPHISQEEHKVEVETRKILGTFADGTLSPHRLRVSSTCTRVNVLEGHTETVSVSLKKKASVSQVAEVWRAWRGAESARMLPTAPHTTSKCSTTLFVPSRGSIARRMAEWPPAWGASARIRSSRMESNTCSSPTIPRWAPPKARCWWRSCFGSREFSSEKRVTSGARAR